MNLRNRPARVAAATGAVVVAGAATMLAVAAGTASADEPGRCLQNVNIREEPDAQSRIVALCEEGTQVKLGAERDGFVRIDELGGWASKDYVKADETPSPGSSGGSDSENDSDGSSSASSNSAGSDSGDSHAAGDRSDGADDGRSSRDEDETPRRSSGAGEHSSADIATSGNSGLLGGLLP